MGNTARVVLVVDDDDSIRSLIAISLEQNGYEIIPARNGREALALWKRRRTDIDLVITDIEMPEMSGIELAKRLNRFHADMPILFVSGSAEASTLRDQVHVNGPVHLLSKPFNVCTLSEIVAGLMHSAPHNVSAVS